MISRSMISRNINDEENKHKNKQNQYMDNDLGVILNQAMKEKPLFWKNIIEEHVASCYNMVTIHKNYFEDLLANNMPTGDIMIELITRKTIREIPIKELLYTIKKIYENSRIVDMVEIDENDMILYHNYRNQNAIHKLKKIILFLLENGGHSYEAKSTSNMIILKYIETRK